MYRWMRRAASKTSGLLLAGVIFAFVILAISGAWFLGGFGDPFRGIEKINAESYIESAKSFQGGVFQFQGEIDSELSYESGRGRLFAVRVSTSNGPVFLPVLIPEMLGRISPQKGQNYRLKVVGQERGVLVAQKMEKI
jgi:hypothetical protein